jgi:hypothetical protein
MANEFHYCVSLSIAHPSVDPKSITAVITSLRPKIETMAGSERRAKDGTTIVPQRKAALSHWLADLHDEKRLYSGDKAISEVILTQLEKLEKHTDFLSQLRHQGVVALIIGWFGESNYSAGVLSADMLKKCGDLGIDIELNYYGPSAPQREPASNPS